MVLPSHGVCFGIFTLAHSLKYTPAADLGSWIRSAEGRSSYLAGAITHQPLAVYLLQVGFAIDSEEMIRASAELRRVSDAADRETLLTIAAMVLRASPPDWLHVVCGEGRVSRDLIPTADSAALSWMDPDLEDVLLSVASGIPSGADMIKARLGALAELVVFECLQRQGARPVHVSKISDHYGYDIASLRPGRIHWEVKGCTGNSVGRFHISRNEFNRSREHPEVWRLVQVEFAANVFSSPFVGPQHVAGILELSPNGVEDCVPSDSHEFVWEESAMLTPPKASWQSSAIRVFPEMNLSGLWGLDI